MHNDTLNAARAPDGATPTRERAASELVALAAAGALSSHAIRHLGSAVVGFPLDLPVWRLKGWDEARRLGPATGLVAMERALARVFEPQRVRLGARWVKDADGRVASKCVPATDLPPGELAARLRALCLAEVNNQAELVAGDCAAERDDLAAAMCLVSEFSLRPAIHPHSPEPLRGPAHVPGEEEPPAEEFFEAFAVHLDEREREVLRGHLQGEQQGDIAARVDCSVRTVGRIWEQVKRKARAFDPGPHNGERSVTMTHEGLWKLLRTMTPDEIEDMQAGYPASWYRRRAAALRPAVPVAALAVEPDIERGAPAADALDLTASVVDLHVRRPATPERDVAGERRAA